MSALPWPLTRNASCIGSSSVDSVRVVVPRQDRGDLSYEEFVSLAAGAFERKHSRICDGPGIGAGIGRSGSREVQCEWRSLDDGRGRHSVGPVQGDASLCGLPKRQSITTGEGEGEVPAFLQKTTRGLIALSLALALAMALSGCANLPKLIREVAKDPATFHLSVRSIYVTLELDRANPRTNTPPHTLKDGVISVGGQ